MASIRTDQRGKKACNSFERIVATFRDAFMGRQFIEPDMINMVAKKIASARKAVAALRSGNAGPEERYFALNSLSGMTASIAQASGENAKDLFQEFKTQMQQKGQLLFESYKAAGADLADKIGLKESSDNIASLNFRSEILSDSIKSSRSRIEAQYESSIAAVRVTYITPDSEKLSEFRRKSQQELSDLYSRDPLKKYLSMGASISNPDFLESLSREELNNYRSWDDEFNTLRIDIQDKYREGLDHHKAMVAEHIQPILDDRDR